jgi:hypothetical protein
VFPVRELINKNAGGTACRAHPERVFRGSASNFRLRRCIASRTASHLSSRTHFAHIWLSSAPSKLFATHVIYSRVAVVFIKLRDGLFE